MRGHRKRVLEAKGDGADVFWCQKKMGEKKSQKVGSAKTVLVIY